MNCQRWQNLRPPPLAPPRKQGVGFLHKFAMGFSVRSFIKRKTGFDNKVLIVPFENKNYIMMFWASVQQICTFNLLFLSSVLESP